MSSKTDIANRALSKVGEQRVSNVDTQDIKAAKVIRFMWDSVLDAALAAFPWNFAVTRIQIAQDAAAPVWGYTKQYLLPSDFLTLLEIQNNPDYRLEIDQVTGSKYILTNTSSPLFIRYIRRVIDTGAFDPLFVEYFATRLAFESVEELTQSNTKKQILAEELRQNIIVAYASDSIQDPPVKLQADEWLIAREQSVVFNDIDFNTTT